MYANFARARSKEAPMAGIEFTNRPNPVPAWRAHDKENTNNVPSKRSHDAALPPSAPFDPKNCLAEIPRPVLGQNVPYLFRPNLPSSTPDGWGGSSVEIPEVDMKDVERSPARPQPSRSFGQAGSEAARKYNGKEDYEGKERRDESESPERRRRISTNAVRRIARRRKDARTHSRTNRTRDKVKAGYSDEDEGSGDDEEDSDDETLRKGRAVTRSLSNHYTLNMPGPPPAKTDTPYILLGYLQFLFNLSLILVFLYLLVQFIFTVQRDVEQRIGEYSMDILQEITTCAQLYKQNLCDTSPIPAMLHQCATWETCMNRDPKVVGRARVGAEMLAEVVNSFIEPISWKTLLFTLSSLAFMTIFVNGLVMLYRARLHPDRQSQHPQATSSSSSHASAQLPGHVPMPSFPPPFHGGYAYLPPGHVQQPPHLSWHPESEVEGIPRQRRRLENGETALVKT